MDLMEPVIRNMMEEEKRYIKERIREKLEDKSKDIPAITPIMIDEVVKAVDG